ncbi:glycosyltransferase family 2 protein [Flavitalea flava]
MSTAQTSGSFHRENGLHDQEQPAFLTVVIITFNEEKNISRCMDSVRAVADEIIVMDSFSTDRTAEIVLRMGGKLHQRAFDGYGAQRNAGTAIASHDHILFLDADEFLSETLSESILVEKERGFPADGYLMNRLNNYCGKWIHYGSWYPDRKLRILSRQKGNWNLDIVHESLIPDNSARIGLLNGDLLHYAYSTIDEHMDKNNRYSTLSAQSMYQKGKRANAVKIVINPFWAFFSGYFLRAGFLDGFYGWVIAVNVAHLTFLKYIKLYQLQQRK